MARRYSKKKGQSGSTKPSIVEKPSWLKLTDKEIKDLIVNLAKDGKTSSEIGIILRDSYGVPDVSIVCHKTITMILKEAGIEREIPEDLLALIKRDLALEKHRTINKKDMTAKRGQQLTMSKISKISRYYKKNSILPNDWKYDRSKAAQWIS